ncbi:MAG: hypothetical protein PVH87_06305 [Desulfobacteraceae bacterium]|jgi:hypothetical protein
MASLLLGFVGMVLIPALILSLIMGKLHKSPTDYGFQEESLRFTISSDTK